MVTPSDSVEYTIEDEETLETTDEEANSEDITAAIDLAIKYDGAAPDPADYGVWVPGIPVIIGNGLEAIHCADWLQGLILDGIVASEMCIRDRYRSRCRCSTWFRTTDVSIILITCYS